MKKRGREIHILLGAALITAAAQVFMTSCAYIDTPVWSQFHEIGAGGWSPEDIMVFEPESQDSTGFKGHCYDLKLIFRSSSRRQISELPIAVTIEDDEGLIKSDTIVLGARENKSQITSRSKFGVTETTLSLLTDSRVGEGFSVTVSPLLDSESNQGLLNVGLEMRESVPKQRSTDQN
ncbi:MAG: hypothetical protein K2G67_07270 [Muribaculaceae bacterium]|nr:hypothetical protein [Muribaculaceae bacterium]